MLFETWRLDFGARDVRGLRRALSNPLLDPSVKHQIENEDKTEYRRCRHEEKSTSRIIHLPELICKDNRSEKWSRHNENQHDNHEQLQLLLFGI